ncbi:hypothetical protein CVO74_09265 [Xanthomonas prunicola]|uniref:Uncharacterized protein n=1 Tax=Xanthomonas prunicola TaxID=2053930 RepID=A0A2N3RM22_9XANT|nr:hypothetical protein XpruCFBP8353_07215 [Xanthomonas prunicola]PKV17796.1 hypothetical protein XpruCFBP8354_07215 [Xanthomonas prunicola]PKV21692.1 hypothetical protein CVO74_09265 [Xanthomonas prunicola]
MRSARVGSAAARNRTGTTARGSRVSSRPHRFTHTEFAPVSLKPLPHRENPQLVNSRSMAANE